MKIELHNTSISTLSRNVTVRIMLPNGYENSDKKYPVLYMHDGQDLFYDKDAVGGKSWGFGNYYNSYNKFLPEIIIVAIDCPLDRGVRTAQYAPYTKHFDVGNSSFESEIKGEGNEYLEWIVNELKDWVDKNYRTRCEKEYTAIGGSSSGGLNSTYAILKYPEVFTRLIAMSNSFFLWQDKIMDTFNNASIGNIKYVYMDVGTNEFGRITTKEQFVESNKVIYNEFLKKGLTNKQIKFTIIEGIKHNQTEWGKRFPDAVRWVFQDI